MERYWPLVIILPLIALSCLVVRWQNIAHDANAECLKQQAALIELQRQHPDERYYYSSCYL